jgi:hypothetical protein
MDKMSKGYKNLKSGVTDAIKKQTHKVLPGLGGLAVGAAGMAASGFKTIGSKVGNTVASHFANGVKNTGESVNQGSSSESQSTTGAASQGASASAPIPDGSKSVSESAIELGISANNIGGSKAAAQKQQAQTSSTGKFKQKVNKKGGRKKAFSKNNIADLSAESKSGSIQNNKNKTAIQSKGALSKNKTPNPSNDSAISQKSSMEGQKYEDLKNRAFTSPKSVEGVRV